MLPSTAPPILSLVAAIDDVFSPAVIAGFAETLPASDGLVRQRYKVLAAHGPYPHDDRAAYKLRFLRAERASWEAYLNQRA